MWGEIIRFSNSRASNGYCLGISAERFVFRLLKLYYERWPPIIYEIAKTVKNYSKINVNC